MTETITTERLILAPHKTADFDESAALWGNPETVKYIGGHTRPRSEVWTKLMYHKGHWETFGYGCYTLRHKETGQYLGEIGLNHFMRDSEPSYSSEMPEGGWVLDPTAQGKGYASEALKAILDKADSGTRITNDICCLIDDDNLASRALAKKFGFVQQPGKINLGGDECDLWVRKRCESAV